MLRPACGAFHTRKPSPIRKRLCGAAFRLIGRIRSGDAIPVSSHLKPALPGIPDSSHLSAIPCPSRDTSCRDWQTAPSIPKFPHLWPGIGECIPGNTHLWARCPRRRSAVAALGAIGESIPVSSHLSGIPLSIRGVARIEGATIGEGIPENTHPNAGVVPYPETLTYRRIQARQGIYGRLLLIFPSFIPANPHLSRGVAVPGGGCALVRPYPETLTSRRRHR